MGLSHIASQNPSTRLPLHMASWWRRLSLIASLVQRPSRGNEQPPVLDAGKGKASTGTGSFVDVAQAPIDQEVRRSFFGGRLSDVFLLPFSQRLLASMKKGLKDR